MEDPVPSKSQISDIHCISYSNRDLWNFFSMPWSLQFLLYRIHMYFTDEFVMDKLWLWIFSRFWRQYPIDLHSSSALKKEVSTSTPAFQKPSKFKRNRIRVWWGNFTNLIRWIRQRLEQKRKQFLHLIESLKQKKIFFELFTGYTDQNFITLFSVNFIKIYNPCTDIKIFITFLGVLIWRW